MTNFGMTNAKPWTIFALGQTYSLGMKLVFIFAVLLLPVSLAAQSSHGTCAEDNEAVGSPLRGWIGYTNTGESVSEITVECFGRPNDPPIASTRTDNDGKFSFPQVGPGKYYLKATKRLEDGMVVAADGFVTVAKGRYPIACMAADSVGPGGECTETTFGRCFSVHGRYAIYANADGIWIVGTKRVLRTTDNRLDKMIMQKGDWLDYAIVGDFQVCPRSIYKPGRLQQVCMQRYENIHIVKWDRNSK
jgi:hypothetical protein